MEIDLKLKSLYGKDRASVEELISNRAGKSILPYEIVFNDDVDWENYLKEELREYFEKACVIYSNYSYLIKRKKPLPFVDKKISNEDMRRFFEVLRAL